MSGTICLKTARLLLRKYEITDVNDLYVDFGRDEDMYRYPGWNSYTSKEKTQETVEHYLRAYRDPHFYGWAVCIGGKLIGTIGAYDDSAEDNSIEIGLSIIQNYWGKSYANEAL